MNHIQYQEAVKKAVRGKFHGHSSLNSRSKPRYPESAEREFKRLTNGYMRLLNEALKKHLPDIMAPYKAEKYGVRHDDMSDLESHVRREFQKVAQEMEQKLSAYGLEDLVAKISRMTKNSSLREWKRVVHDTLGIDLLNDYYSADFYEEALRRWVDANILKIKSIPQETLGEMQQIVTEGFRKGQTITAITKEIQKQYGVSKHRAQMLARDQVSTLNAQISKMQQQDAGCNRYKWSDSRDSRVRDCHHSLNGQIFSWDDPPEMWYMTKKSGIVYTGRRCHPGEDFACRCVAIPIFDADTLDVPMKDMTRAKG